MEKVKTDEKLGPLFDRFYILWVSVKVCWYLFKNEFAPVYYPK